MYDGGETRKKMRKRKCFEKKNGYLTESERRFLTMSERGENNVRIAW